MDCPDRLEILLCLNGELEETRGEEVRKHLESCGTCQAIKEEMIALRREVADVLERV